MYWGAPLNVKNLFLYILWAIRSITTYLNVSISAASPCSQMREARGNKGNRGMLTASVTSSLLPHHWGCASCEAPTRHWECLSCNCEANSGLLPSQPSAFEWAVPLSLAGGRRGRWSGVWRHWQLFERLLWSPSSSSSSSAPSPLLAPRPFPPGPPPGSPTLAPILELTEGSHQLHHTLSLLLRRQL